MSENHTVKASNAAYLQESYPFQATGEAITDIDTILSSGVLYEIQCPNCGMAVRSQGRNIKIAYARLLHETEIKNEDGSIRISGGKGCIGCGNRQLIVKEVDTSKMG